MAFGYPRSPTPFLCKGGFHHRDAETAEFHRDSLRSSAYSAPLCLRKVSKWGCHACTRDEDAGSRQFHPHNCSEAIRAPSTSDASFIHTIFESTCRRPAKVPNPQSTPAITFSLPTTPA